MNQDEDKKFVLVFSKENEEFDKEIYRRFANGGFEVEFVRTFGDIIYRLKGKNYELLFIVDLPVDQTDLLFCKVEFPTSLPVLFATEKKLDEFAHTNPIRVHRIDYPIDMKQLGGVIMNVFTEKKVKGDSEKVVNNVLVVEDDEVNQEILNDILTRRQFQVKVVGDGVSALLSVEEKRPDCILLDYMLPDINGDHVLYWIRQKYSLDELPVFVISSQDSKDDIITFKKLGVSGYILKPFDPEKLVEKLMSV